MMQDISFFAFPIPDHAFLSRRFSSICSATTSFRSRASLRRSRTSSLLAARDVSPASLRVASLHEVLRPFVIYALRDTFLAAQLSDTVIAAQAFQHDPGSSLPRYTACGLLYGYPLQPAPRALLSVLVSFPFLTVTAMKPKHSLISCSQSVY